MLAVLLQKPKLDEDLLRLCVEAMEKLDKQQSKNGLKNGHHLAALVKA